MKTMKDGPHQWPSGAATRKYVDRATDRLGVRCDRQTERIRGLQADLVLLRNQLEVMHAVVLNLKQG